MKTKMIIDNIRLSVCCFSLPPPLDNHDHDYANADDHNDEDDNDEDDLEQGDQVGFVLLTASSDLSPAAPLAVAIAILPLNMMRI